MDVIRKQSKSKLLLINMIDAAVESLSLLGASD